jgi:hypothetical protein
VASGRVLSALRGEQKNLVEISKKKPGLDLRQGVAAENM